MNPDWIDDFEAAENDLREHTDAKSNTPAQLLIPADAPHDDLKWRTIVAWLLERGWRTAVDSEGGLWFYAPGPLSDPGDEARNAN